MMLQQEPPIAKTEPADDLSVGLYWLQWRADLGDSSAAIVLQYIEQLRGEVVELRATLEDKERREAEHFKTLAAFDPWRGEKGEAP